MHPIAESTMSKSSERTCVGCGRADAPSALLRFVLDGDHVVPDVAGSAFGRGAHVHAASDCVAKACKAGFARSFKTKVVSHVSELSQQIEEAYDRRVVGLVLGARRAGHVAIGREAALEATGLLVVARDAALPSNSSVSRSIAEGHAVVWKDKASLGALFGRDEVAMFRVTLGTIAEQIKIARSRSEACKAREER
jgi:predicted RNA-binding protein YlxR (DUF448 family)